MKIRAIQRLEVNGTLVGYRLQDETGNVMDASKDSIKRVLRNGKADIVNLKLTSDDRLIYSEPKIKNQHNKFTSSRGFIYLMSIMVNEKIVNKAHSYDNAILVIKDMNFEIKRLKFEMVKKMILNGYTGLNFKLSNDQNTIEYKQKDARDISNSNRYIVFNTQFGKEISLLDKSTGESIGESIYNLHTLKTAGIDGVEFGDNGQLETLLIYRLEDLSKSYKIIKFFNHMILELSDHPNEARSALYNALNSIDYNPRFGGSAADDARGLYLEYMSLQDILNKADLRAVLENDTTNKYCILFNRMNEYSYNAKYKDTKTPDTFYDEIITLCKLPKWVKEKVRIDLYMLSR